MSIDEFCERNDTTRSEERELRWYLAFLRWRKSMQGLFGLDA